MTQAAITHTDHDLGTLLSEDRLAPAVVERAEAVAFELATHAGVRPVVMGQVAMELASEWHAGRTPLDGDGAPIVLLPRLTRWLVLKLGETDAIFVFSGRESAMRRARELALEQGVAFYAIGPAGRITDRAAATRQWDPTDFDSDVEREEAEVAAEPERIPIEIRIEKRGRRYAVLVDDVEVATASNKQRALRKADALRNDPDLVTRPVPDEAPAEARS